MKLQLSDIEKTLPFTIQRGIVLPYICKLADGSYHIELDYDVFLQSKNKNLQRPFCWTLFQKQELIISVLKGIQLQPIQIIIYSDDLCGSQRNSVYKIIDGKQRLSTIISFYNNEFPLIWNNIEYFFDDLDDNAQRRIKFLDLTSDRVYEYPDAMISDDDKIAWFEMINFAGTQQDVEHLNNLKM
jgi:hypothetical protein